MKVEFIKKEIIHKSNDGVLTVAFDEKKIEEHFIEATEPVMFRITRFNIGLPKRDCLSYASLSFEGRKTGKLCGRRHHISDWIHYWTDVPRNGR